jgi:hypothetical protein
MEASFELEPPPISGWQPLDLKPFSLPPRYRPIDGEALEVDACKRRCGTTEPSFVQLHSHRRLFAAADPAEMRRLIEEARPSIEVFRTRAGRSERQKCEKLLAALAKLAHLDLAETPAVRMTQQVYFNDFIPLMDLVRNAEGESIRAEQNRAKSPADGWFLKRSG